MKKYLQIAKKYLLIFLQWLGNSLWECLIMTKNGVLLLAHIAFYIIKKILDKKISMAQQEENRMKNAILADYIDQMQKELTTILSRESFNVISKVVAPANVAFEKITENANVFYLCFALTLKSEDQTYPRNLIQADIEHANRAILNTYRADAVRVAHGIFCEFPLLYSRKYSIIAGHIVGCTLEIALPLMKGGL